VDGHNAGAYRGDPHRDSMKEYPKIEELLEYSNDKQAFKSLSSRFSQCNGERFSIMKFRIEKSALERANTRPANPLVDRTLEPGEYVKLYDENLERTIMSNSPMEFYTNYEFIKKCRGDVLIGGLGLGLVVLLAEKKPEVKSITVAEKHLEIIRLVASQIIFNSKVLIEHSDIFNFAPQRRYDTIYFDIWDDVCAANYDEMKRLRGKYAGYLNDGGWMGCWSEDECIKAGSGF